MKNKFLLLLFFFGLSSNVLAQEVAYQVDEAKAIIEKFYEEENIQGLSIAVSIDDEIVLSEGYGFSDLDNTIPIESDKTLFRIASISKPLTAIGLAKLVEDGKMEFSESIYTYVPDFPKKQFDFTLRDLSSHTAGIRHYKGREAYNKKALSIEEGLNFFKDSKLLFEPGTDYSYSTYGYNLLSVAIQNASGNTFENYMLENVLLPLGMENTIPDTGNYDNLQISGFYQQNKKGVSKPGTAINIYFKLAGGGYLSTAEDLLKMGQAMTDNRFLSDETREEMTKGTTLKDGSYSNYGIGWGVRTDKEGWLSYSHSGGTIGGVSKLIVYPEQKAVVTILANENCDYIGMDTKAREVVKALLK